MAKSMRVRVKDGMKGWYCGKLYHGRDPEAGRHKSDQFVIKEREHSIKVVEDENGEPVLDKDGNAQPLIITVEQQFSSRWMEPVGERKQVIDETVIEEPEDVEEPAHNDVITGVHPSEMSVNELKAELKKAGIKVPGGSNKKDLIDLLESYISENS